MLWSCPTLAHRPIVSGLNLTFEDASNSAASERDIQSDGGFDIGQSGTFAGAAFAGASLAGASVPDEAPLSPADDSVPPPEEELSSLRSTRAGLPVLDLSLRAQPLPL